ncbi:MAG TPA: signal recognition particle-docking protein FtsY [Acidobacteriota bacterium]
MDRRTWGLVDFERGQKYNVWAVWGNLGQKLSRTRQVFKQKLEGIFLGPKERDQVLAELEEALILADAGPAATDKIIQHLRLKSKKGDRLDGLEALLKEELMGLLAQVAPDRKPLPWPLVLMMVGANGGGKTTSAAKLAFRLKTEGRTVLLAAADTFRAAAQEQLALWGKKLDLPVVRGQYGADPAAVVFDAIQSLKARGYQALVVDTAGRLHTNHNLMAELEKIRRIAGREISGAPHETLLVLDASIGRNSLVQAREFLKFSGLSGIFLSKLDGTAKGGSGLAIVEELRLPIRYIGTGEGELDVEDFSAREFVEALLS